MPQPNEIIGQCEVLYKEQMVTVDIPFKYLSDPYNIHIPVNYIQNYDKIEQPDYPLCNISEMKTTRRKKKCYEIVIITSKQGKKVLLDYFDKYVWLNFQNKWNDIKRSDSFGYWVCQFIPQHIKWGAVYWRTVIEDMIQNNEI